MDWSSLSCLFLVPVDAAAVPNMSLLLPQTASRFPSIDYRGFNHWTCLCSLRSVDKGRARMCSLFAPLTFVRAASKGEKASFSELGHMSGKKSEVYDAEPTSLFGIGFSWKGPANHSLSQSSKPFAFLWLADTSLRIRTDYSATARGDSARLANSILVRYGSWITAFPRKERTSIANRSIQ